MVFSRSDRGQLWSAHLRSDRGPVSTWLPRSGSIPLADQGFSKLDLGFTPSEALVHMPSRRRRHPLVFGSAVFGSGVEADQEAKLQILTFSLC